MPALQANIEQQNKKSQKDEVITSIFEISCSIFYVSKKRPFGRLRASGQRAEASKE
jgi:hypothetical protein